MNCAIMQPTYFPWMGYFDLIDQTDIFILLDDVQLVKRSWQVRNKIRTSNGPLFLTVPIAKTLTRDECTIQKAEINYENYWHHKHLNSIRNSYARSPYFDLVFTWVESVYEKKFQFLSDLNRAFIISIADTIGINTKIITASSLGNIEGKKDTRLANICLHVGADQYLSPQGSADYLESGSPGGNIAENNIEVYYHNYDHPTYRQLYEPFIPYICILDLLFNKGFDDALEVIRSGRRKNYSSIEFREKILKIQ